jgi:hypothetical protein
LGTPDVGLSESLLLSNMQPVLFFLFALFLKAEYDGAKEKNGGDVMTVVKLS